ncbi:protocadherin Fat 4-like [Haliotis cracherodii]|uniref:protocadherin Fat 4-like n=1 Tax=Haliotis cracherodii TaxID=6455 RepID=UPI0039EBA475
MNGAALVTEDTPLNYESLVATDFMYILIVKAEDTPSDEASKSNVAVVVVKVLPENEFSPQFTLPAETSMTVTETTKPPYLLTTFNAVDEDAGADGDVSYEILSVTDSMGDSALDKFLINSVSGELRLNDFLDADTATGGTDSYNIVVKATDAGATPMSTNRDFLITVENENDNAPQFLNFPASTDVVETTDIGHALLTLTTEDNDGDDVVASIEDGDKTLFIISGNNVILEQPLDFETSQCHTIVVGISDGTNKINRTLVIKVTDVIDETPSIVTLTPVDVTEELPVGTKVGGLFLLTDLDRGDSHTFTLTGDDSHFFNIDADSGQVSIAERMDLESMSGTNVLDHLILTVTDTGGLQATADLSVVIVDINDATPVFAESVYKVSVSEGSPKEVLVDLVATDADSGTNGDISMQIAAGDDPVTPRFELSGTQLSSLDNLDYESLADTQYMFLLTVEATDLPDKESPKTGVTMVAVTVLPVNEFAPDWATSLSLTGSALPDLTMLENATVGSDLLTLEATDSDQGADGDVTYIVTSAITNTGESAEGLFTLNPVSGTLRTAGYLDRDVTTGEMYYDLTLTARDRGDPYKETSVTLKIILDNVNDNAPEFTMSEYQIEVPESTAVDTAIYTFTAADVDGDVVTYSIKGGDTDVFDVQGNSLVTRIALDYETVSWYSLLVEASDGLYTTTNLLLVKVTDVIDEKPVITVSNPVTLLEEMPIGTDVSWTFDVTDKDVTDNLLYSLSGTDKEYFNINPDTGELTVSMRLDREVKANIDLTLQVEDSSGLFTEADMFFTLADVNDMAPSFNANIHVVYTTEGQGDVDLMTLVVTDQDEAYNAAFDVTITSGNDGGEFWLDGLVLKCDSSMMDYETASVNNYTYILSVQAVDKPTDGGSLTGSTVVIVHVQPQNEFEPAWEYPVLDVDGGFPQIHVDENIATGYVVITFDARDQDAGIDGDVTYDIISATDENSIDRSNLFTLDKNQGILRTSGKLDFDQSTGGFESVSLVVQATDDGAVQKSTEGIQVILLYNVNDNPPHFTDAPSEVEVKENLDIDVVILDLQVADHDGDAVTLALSGSDAFQIVGTSITLQHQVDFESRQCHTLTVSASDGTHVSNISLTIHVLNVVDEAPEVTLLPPLTLIEEQPIGIGVGWFFSVSDPDVNDTVTYTLSGSGADNFNLESSGELTIAKRIDRDSPGDVSFIDDLLLTVTDSAGLQTSVSWNLTVVDMNDNAPVCDVTGQVNITENSDEGIVIADIACTDLDSGEYEVVVLDLGTATNQFQISGTQLMTGGDPIDYEGIGDWNFVYNVKIVAVDNPAGEPRLTSTSIVTVKVLPVNEHTPVFKDIVGDGHFVEVSVAEDADVGTVVNTFVATDVDLGSDGHVTYGIQSVISDSGVQQDGLFTIDASSGQLRVSSQLDADAATGGVNYYTVNITATDAGSSPRSTHGALRVVVTGTNDNPPVWNITDQEIDVFENASVGQDVVYLMADDVDGGAVTFSTFDTKFKVDGSMLKVEQQLDFEFQRCHTLTVSATDGKYTVDQTLVVNVLDSNDETPVVTVTKVIYIPEEIPVGTDVARGYFVSDADENDTLTFSLQGGDSDLLVINGTTGQLSLERRLDFETLTSASLDVKLLVTDVAGHTGTQTLDIVVTDVNDNTPTFSSAIHRVKVTEQAAAETDLLTLEATDADDGINGEFSFNITDGNPHNLFRLDGNVLYAQPMDYEEAEAVDFTYSVTVTVVDHATDARTGVTVVVVEIIPENEYDPVLENVTEKSLLEDTEPGFEVLTVHATDADLGEDGVVTYDITSVLSDLNTDAPEKFTIDCDTGVLTTTTELDFDPSTGGASYYDITITATDKGTVPRTSTAVMRVNINDINDIAPAFKDVSYTANVGCNDDEGRELMTLKADDEDGPRVDYTIDANTYLNVNSVSGAVTLLDFPAGDAVSDLAQSVIVTVSDGDLEGKCHLLVLFENCDNTTSVSMTTSATTSVTTTTTNTPCPNVTCNCNSNTTVNDPTTSVTTTTTTTTTTTPKTAACVCNNATSAVSSTTTKPVTCPSDVTASPCVCSNNTTAAAAAADTDAGDTAEVWAMRALVVVMSMMMMAMVAVYLKSSLTKVPQSTPINKVQPRTNSVERGIGSDDYGLKIEDL